MSIPVKPNEGPARAADQSAVDVGAAAGIRRVPVAAGRLPSRRRWRPRPPPGVRAGYSRCWESAGLAVVLAVAASPQAAITFSAG